MYIKCRIFWNDQTGSYVVSSTFSQKLVEGLKGIIPSSDRVWDEKSKQWHVTEAWGEVVRKVAEAAFGPGTVSFTSKQVTQQHQQQYNQQARYNQYQAPQQSVGTVDSLMLEFTSLLTYDSLKKAYLITAQSLHPDKPTGDTQKMSKLNELWDRVEKEFFKR